jgi:hypothetical protein
VVQVEKNSDDTVKLKILQTALTLLQNPRSVDDKVGLLAFLLPPVPLVRVTVDSNSWPS